MGEVLRHEVGFGCDDFFLVAEAKFRKTMPLPKSLGVTSQPRYDRPKNAGLPFAYFDFGLSGIIHDQ